MKTQRKTLQTLALAAIVAISSIPFFAVQPAAGDTFDCYEGCTTGNGALEGSVCVENAVTGDWHTSCTGLANCPDQGSNTTVLSIHGGRIEQHTSTISADLADLYNWNRYNFDAHLVDGGNCDALATDGNPSNDNSEVLHVTATHFNHAEALTLVGAHPNAVSIHGCGASCSNDTICIGGRNTQQVTDFQNYVNAYSSLLPFTLNASTVPSTFCGSNLAGTATSNIVNRTSTGQGLQLEMSRDVRDSLAGSQVDDDLLRTIVYGGVGVALGELPPPIAVLDRTETYTYNGKTYVRYYLVVENRAVYPQELFDLAPGLPSCSGSGSSPRTWVSILDASDSSYVYGFCGFTSPDHLAYIWFAREQGTAPSEVVVVLDDRATNTLYRSNRISIP